MCQGMNHAKPFLKRRCPHGCGNEHAFTGFQVLTVFHSPGQPLKNQLKTLQSNAVGNGMKTRRKISFQAMDKSINPGGSRNVRR